MFWDWWRNLLGRMGLAPVGDLGARGEHVAARFLRRKKYHVIGYGQRSRLGEIDLIAVDPTDSERVVVFVEVKTRRGDQAGRPADAIDVTKQARTTRAALNWLKRHDLLGRPARFDVIAITWPDDRKEPQIEHLVAAFEAVGGGQMFS